MIPSCLGQGTVAGLQGHNDRCGEGWEPPVRSYHIPWALPGSRMAGALEPMELSLLFPSLWKSLLGLEEAHSLQMDQGF